MITCRYCGSSNITTLGGEDGDPFNSCPAPMSVVCCDCGKKLWDEEDSDGPIPKTYVDAHNVWSDWAEKDKECNEADTARSAGDELLEKCLYTLTN